MTQPAFKVDGLLVEPGQPGTRKVERAPSGELLLRDPSVPGGLVLAQLAGLTTLEGVRVVGRAGAGAQFTSLQEAFNDIPITSSSEEPHVVVVFPGVYLGNLVLDRSGVTVVGLGRVVVSPVTVAPALRIESGVSATPFGARFVGLEFQQPNPGRAAVSIQGGPGSEVADEGVLFESCNFNCSGVGSYTVDAYAVGKVELLGCECKGSHTTSSLRVRQCSLFHVRGGSHTQIQMEYSTGADRPADTTSSYELSGLSRVGDVLVNLSGEGNFRMVSCPRAGDVTLRGDRNHEIRGCSLGSLSLNDTSSVWLRFSSYGSALGTGTLDVETWSGTEGFGGDTSRSVSFPVPSIDEDYSVSVESESASIPWVTGKTAAGFEINFADPQSTGVRWTCWRKP